MVLVGWDGKRSHWTTKQLKYITCTYLSIPDKKPLVSTKFINECWQRTPKKPYLQMHMNRSLYPMHKPCPEQCINASHGKSEMTQIKFIVHCPIHFYTLSPTFSSMVWVFARIHGKHLLVKLTTCALLVPDRKWSCHGREILLLGIRFPAGESS